MSKEEASTKKTEANEKGAAASNYTVNYEDIRRKKICKCGVGSCVALVILVSVVFLAYADKQLRYPRFMLDDLYMDSVSNSSVLVKLKSKNPSPSIGIYYSKISVYVQIQGGFETERVFLESTNQEPREVTTWTAVVASNYGNNDKPDGSFQIRNGLTKGSVIADLSFKWKSSILPLKSSLHVMCPVLLNLKDLTSANPKPMSSCSAE